MARPDLGAHWIASISDLALAYGLDADTMQQRVYALAEQIHMHYCFNSGPVNHREARPDEHIAAGILGALAATGWWMVKADERVTPTAEGCGFWIADAGLLPADPNPGAWWECVIPDVQHQDREHLLRRMTRDMFPPDPLSAVSHEGVVDDSTPS